MYLGAGVCVRACLIACGCRPQNDLEHCSSANYLFKTGTLSGLGLTEQARLVSLPQGSVWFYFLRAGVTAAF